MTSFKRIAAVKILLTKAIYPNQPIPVGPNAYTGSISFSKLRIAFNIKKNISWATNSGSISIWNLSLDNRNRLEDFGDNVTLSAGYEEDIGPQILYIGDVCQVSHAYSQPDIITTLECGQSDRPLNNIRISVSYPPDTPVRQVIRDVAGYLKISILEFADTPNVVYPNGKPFNGMAKDLLDQACEYLGVRANLADNGLQILPLDQGSSVPPFQINANTGMIGVPQRYTYKGRQLYAVGPETGWIVQTRLNPLINPGARVNIVSSRVDLPSGTFKVQSVRHQGDTYSDTWSSSFEVTLL